MKFAITEISKKELVSLIYKHFYDKESNCIDLTGLNFAPYDCNVCMDYMRVNGDISQKGYKVSGNLNQSGQIVGQDLYQGEQTVKGDLHQSNIKVKGEVVTEFETIKKPEEETNKEEHKMSKTELVDLIYNNFYDSNYNKIKINRLDFGRYHCKVDISEMSVDGDLCQGHHKVTGDIYQESHEVLGAIVQNHHRVGRYLAQDGNRVKGDLFQEEQKVGGTLTQYGTEVDGNVFLSCNQRVGKKYVKADTDLHIMGLKRVDGTIHR